MPAKCLNRSRSPNHWSKSDEERSPNRVIAATSLLSNQTETSSLRSARPKRHLSSIFSKAFSGTAAAGFRSRGRFGFTDAKSRWPALRTTANRFILNLQLRCCEKIGLGPEALKCGVHEPYGVEAAAELRSRGEQPNVLHNNCSGKHAGMLAVAKHLGAPIRELREPGESGAEGDRRRGVAILGRCSEDMAVGIDGCAAPIFGITVKAMALAYARLVSPPANFDKATRDACERIVRVMSAYPELIGGTSDRLDTEIMRAAPGRVDFESRR